VSEPVRVDGDIVRTLTLNRPDRRNAIDDEVHRALVDALRAAAEAPDVGAIVITGAGPAFSAGGDLAHMRIMQSDRHVRRETLATGKELFDLLTTMTTPVVAAVNGPAVGAGCTLALLCDIAIVADDAYLADPHVNVGLVPGDGGAALWPLLTGLPAARYYLLTGDRIPALEAHRLGLIHQVTPHNEVLQDAVALADRLAALPRPAVHGTKQALNLHVTHAASQVFDQALAAEDACFDTEDHHRVVDALVASRPDR
jgi:enoyl-CoA hydratase/carnithine racemase